jgi:hypothetical protein
MSQKKIAAGIYPTTLEPLSPTPTQQALKQAQVANTSSSTTQHSTLKRIMHIRGDYSYKWTNAATTARSCSNWTHSPQKKFPVPFDMFISHKSLFHNQNPYSHLEQDGKA